MKAEILQTSSFAHEAAAFIISVISQDIKNKGKCVLGLSGGTTPIPVYKEMAKNGKSIDWKKVIFTFSDERCVPPDHEESNYKKAKESLFDHIDIPSENVHRLEGELSPKLAARSYEEKIPHIHDLLLLGIGSDGHTASLFPGTEGLLDNERLVIANFIPKLNSMRLTFTFKLINSSRKICFLVNDIQKKSVVDEILKGNSNYPAEKVIGTEQTIWFLGY